MKKWPIFLFLFIGIFTVLLTLFFILPKDKIAFGVKIAGINVGGLTQEKAREKLEFSKKEFENQSLIFYFKDLSEAFPIKDLNLSFDFESNLEKAFEVGRKGGLILKFKEKIFALLGKYNFPLKAEVLNEEGLSNFIGTKFGIFETLPKNAKLSFDKKTLSFEILPHENGKVFDLKKIKEEIEKSAALFKPGKIQLELIEKEPLIKKEDLIQVKEEAESFINEDFLIISPKKSFLLKKSEIGEMLEIMAKKEGESLKFSLTINEEALASFLENKKREIEILPQNPILEIENEKVKIKAPGKKGVKMDLEKSIERIKRAFEEKRHQAELVMEEVECEIDEEKIQKFKIEKILGKAATSFASSPRNRIHNIRLGTQIVSGKLLPPNEIFSLNQTLGEVSVERGFLPELVIKGRKMIPEPGGGVCQISTTLFRAAVFAGLEILERTPHAFALRYYGTPGFDATVYFPSPDLKFKNNTGSYIFIQGKIEGTNLIFEIFGPDDGRKVEIEGPTILEVKNDGSMKTRLDMKVFKNGELFLSQTFFSNYKPPALFPVVSR